MQGLRARVWAAQSVAGRDRQGAGERARSELRPWRPSAGTASTVTDRSRGRGDPGEELTASSGARSRRPGVDRSGGNRRRRSAIYVTKTTAMACARAALA